MLFCTTDCLLVKPVYSWTDPNVCVCILLDPLESFRCDGCFLSGKIPTEVGKLVAIGKSLCFLSKPHPFVVAFDDNVLSSCTPKYLSHTQTQCSCITAEVWQSSTNTLTGQIPSEFGQAMMLREINLSKNDLNGPLPTEMGLLTNLSSLDVSTNMLNGPIPSELGSISTPQGTVNVFWRYMYMMQSSVWLCCPFGSSRTWFQNDRHTHTGHVVPSSPNDSPQLTRLLYVSFFHDTIPPCYSLELVSTAMFKLTFNGFTGAVPDELCRSRCCTNAVVTVDAGVASCPDCTTITC